MNLGIFVGTYMDQKLDSKGRLSVPAKWRERLGTEFFMVCMNLRGSTCIKLYPQDEFMHCVEALDDGTANEVYEKNKIFFSNAEECTLDAQGRFTLNARLKDYAGMENGSTVIMQGHKRTIEIWTNEGFNTMFNGLRTDLETLALGCYFAELTETVTAPEVPAGALLPHLLNGLYALSALQKPPALVKPAFEIKLLCLAGYEPLADSCAYCGRPDPEQPLLDVVQGILRCRSCGAKESALSMPLCPDSLAALRHIVYGDPKRLYSFRLTGPALERLSAAAEAFVAAQLERGFRTLDFYKTLTLSRSGG